ncbi:MAG: SMI1/KNR4 family protein [Polyangiaceae bacterium]
MTSHFRDFDLGSFWKDSDYARAEYVEPWPDDAMITSIEAELGVRLPRSYVELMRVQNGGEPRNTRFPTTKATSWSHNHVAITGIMGIGRTKQYSLCGSLGSKFMQSAWGYPKIGICICDCPSAGHDMIMLDYRECGPEGEPAVVHVDQEAKFRITFLAKDFETFVRGLVNESVYDTSAADLAAALDKIDNGSFSTRLSQLLEASGRPELGPTVRRVCRALTEEKGYFALHSDEASMFVYDIQFYLVTTSEKVKNESAYLEAYPQILALGDGAFGTGGYAPNFVAEWLKKRLAQGQIVKSSSGELSFSEAYADAIQAKLRAAMTEPSKSG